MGGGIIGSFRKDHRVFLSKILNILDIAICIESTGLFLERGGREGRGGWGW